MQTHSACSHCYVAEVTWRPCSHHTGRPQAFSLVMACVAPSLSTTPQTLWQVGGRQAVPACTSMLRLLCLHAHSRCPAGIIMMAQPMGSVHCAAGQARSALAHELPWGFKAHGCSMPAVCRQFALAAAKASPAQPSSCQTPALSAPCLRAKALYDEDSESHLALLADVFPASLEQQLAALEEQGMGMGAGGCPYMDISDAPFYAVEVRLRRRPPVSQ